MGLMVVTKEELEAQAPPDHTGHFAAKGGPADSKRRYRAKLRAQREASGESDLLVRLTQVPGLYTKVRRIAEYNAEQGRSPRTMNGLALGAIETWVDREFPHVPEPEAYDEEEPYEED
jgi:hypothetical protein